MKRILAGSLALAILCTGCGSTVSTETTASAEDTNQEILNTLSTREAYLNGAAIDTLDTEVEELKLYNWIGVCDDVLLAREEDIPILEYYDFDQEQWVPLCSKSNCQHDSASCNSWLGDGDYTGFMMQGNDVIYFASDSDYHTLTLMQFDIAEQQQKMICQIDYPEDVIIINSPRWFYYIGDQVYFLASMWAEGENREETITAYYITILNWKKGTILEEIPLPEAGMGFLGVYQDKLVCTGSEQGDDVLSEEAYYAQYGSEGDYDVYLMGEALSTTINVYDLETQSWSELLSFPDFHEVDYPVPWDLYGEYLFYSEGSQVYTLSVETGETELLFTGESEQISLESICCGGLFYIEYSQTDPWYCFYDLSTGCGYRLGEFDSSGNPYAENTDYLIQEAVQYISKEDYFAGN